MDHSCFHILTGLVRPNEEREGDILEAFWAAYKTRCPTHPIYLLAEQNKLSLRRTVPLALHGDEGRGRRRDAFLILSFRSLLGRGLHPQDRLQKRHGIKKKWLKMKANCRGHSFTNRWMFSALRKCDYSGSKESVFNEVLASAAEQALELADTGILGKDNKTYHGMLLHVIGDWVWLHKSGNFFRSYNNVQKRKVVRAPPGGICHMCLAGVGNYWWEQIQTKRPSWKTTMCQESPFISPSVFAQVPHPAGELPLMWAWDWFHCWHLGVAKCFLASSIALLSKLQEWGHRG